MDFESKEDYEQYMGREAQEQMEQEQEANYVEYLSNQHHLLRPFEDLIKSIEIDGESFVPIEEIAKLASPMEIKIIEIFNHCPNHFCMSFTTYEKNGYGFEEKYFWITSIFRFEIFSNTRKQLSVDINQVQIVKNLIKWGFVEP